jgi:hypothetical protein
MLKWTPTSGYIGCEHAWQEQAGIQRTGDKQVLLQCCAAAIKACGPWWHSLLWHAALCTWASASGAVDPIRHS